MQTTRRSNSWGMPQMVGLVGNTAISEGSFTVFMETQTLPRKKRTTLWCWVLQRHGPKVKVCKRRVLCWKFCWNKPLKMNTDLIQLRLVCHIQWTFPCPTLCDLHTFKIHFISRILLRLQVHILSPRKQKWPADIQREPIAYDVLERSEVQNFYIFWHSKSSKSTMKRYQWIFLSCWLESEVPLLLLDWCISFTVSLPKNSVATRPSKSLWLFGGKDKQTKNLCWGTTIVRKKKK